MPINILYGEITYKTQMFWVEILTTVVGQLGSAGTVFSQIPLLVRFWVSAGHRRHLKWEGEVQLQPYSLPSEGQGQAPGPAGDLAHHCWPASRRRGWCSTASRLTAPPAPARSAPSPFPRHGAGVRAPLRWDTRFSCHGIGVAGVETQVQAPAGLKGYGWLHRAAVHQCQLPALGHIQLSSPLADLADPKAPCFWLDMGCRANSSKGLHHQRPRLRTGLTPRDCTTSSHACGQV